MKLNSDDRVLFLAIPPVQELAAIGRILIRGVVVVVGDSDDLDPARSALAEFQNIMLLNGRPDRVPWRAGFFTRIVVPQQLERILSALTPEITRLLAPGGEIVRSGVAA